MLRSRGNTSSRSPRRSASLISLRSVRRSEFVPRQKPMKRRNALLPNRKSEKELKRGATTSQETTQPPNQRLKSQMRNPQKVRKPTRSQRPPSQPRALKMVRTLAEKVRLKSNSNNSLPHLRPRKQSLKKNSIL